MIYRIVLWLRPRERMFLVVVFEWWKCSGRARGRGQMTCIRGDTAATLRRVSSTRPRCRVCVACRYPGGSHHRQNNRESVPNIILNNTINLFFSTAISILLISNRKSLRVLFDKIVSVHFIRKIYLYSSTGNGQPREPALCHLYRHTFVPYSR